MSGWGARDGRGDAAREDGWGLHPPGSWGAALCSLGSPSNLSPGCKRGPRVRLSGGGVGATMAWAWASATGGGSFGGALLCSFWGAGSPGGRRFRDPLPGCRGPNWAALLLVGLPGLAWPSLAGGGVGGEGVFFLGGSCFWKVGLSYLFIFSFSNLMDFFFFF